MSGILGNLFDMSSKEDKQQRYESYSKLIFPYGDGQREKVLELLCQMFPKQKIKYLMLHYILIKEGLVGEEKQSFEEAAAKVAKKKLIRVTPELQVGLYNLLNADLSIDENLEYPPLEELLSRD